MLSSTRQKSIPGIFIFFIFGFFGLKKKNEQARIEIIVFIQSIELQQMEPLTWRKYPEPIRSPIMDMQLNPQRHQL